MTDNEQRWVDETTAQYYMDLLARRYPESRQEETLLAKLTEQHGAEAVIRIADVLEGFVTPQPSAATLGSYALFVFYSRLAEASTTYPISP